MERTASDESPMLSDSEVAAYFKVSLRSVGRMRENGHIRSVRVNKTWRTPQSEIDRLCQKWLDSAVAGGADAASIGPISVSSVS